MKFVLSLNCGTSSAKYAVFERATMQRVCKGIVERVSIGGSFIRHEVSGNSELRLDRDCSNHTDAIGLIFEAVVGSLAPDSGVMNDLADLAAVGHRVVHGGRQFVKSALIDNEVYEAIGEMVEFAPLHIPANLAGIDAVRAHLPLLPQMAIFDTAFFQTLPKHSYLYGSPYEWYEKYGIRKYGFHGTSHLFIAKRAAVMLGKHSSDVNLVTIHIGNGISLTAVKAGVAVEHSMGMTPLDGVMMGTRSGSVDPGIVSFIAEKEGRSAEEVVDIDLNRKSGLLGISGRTDVRDLLAGRAEGDERCSLAFDVYCYKMRLYLGAYLGVLDYDVDAVVFAGGVGENAVDVRSTILAGMERAGIEVDPEKNASLGKFASKTTGEADIATDGSPVRVLVVPTNEEQVLLEDVIALLEGTYDEHTRFRYTFEDPDWKPATDL